LRAVRALIACVLTGLALLACGGKTGEGPSTQAPSSGCDEGTVKSAGDGCNTCSCEDGEWLCTDEPCPEPACVPESPGWDDRCEGIGIHARAEGTDACCELCSLPAGYTYYESREACEASKVCSAGESKYADDQCNTCTCTPSGEWACTTSDCYAVLCGGIRGGDCSDDEYCDTEPERRSCADGEWSGYCRPRPTECPDDETPVCGCDGETYANGCLAAMLDDWGIQHDGPCEAPSPN